MKKSTTNKNVVLLVLGVCCLIAGSIWLSIGSDNIYSINTNAFLLIIAGIIVVYRTLVKTQFKSQKFELKDYWKKVDEEEPEQENKIEDQ